MKRIPVICLAVYMVLCLLTGCAEIGKYTELSGNNMSEINTEQENTNTDITKPSASQPTACTNLTDNITEPTEKQITSEEKIDTTTNAGGIPRLETFWLDDEFTKAEKVYFYKEMNGVLQIGADKKFGLVSKNGETLVPPVYDDIDWFYEDRANIRQNDKYGCVDINGKIIIPVIYDGVGRFNKGCVAVSKDGKIGFFDLAGNIVLPFRNYDQIYGFDEGLAAIKQDGKWGFIDTTGSVVIPIVYDEVSYFVNGLAQVIQDGKKGYIDKTGQVVIPIIYDNNNRYDVYTGQFVEVTLNGKCGLVDGTGEVVVPFEYDYLFNFASGLFKAEKGGKQGVIDKTGNIIIPLIYDSVGYNRDKELFRVVQNGEWGEVDRAGRIIIPLSSDHKRPFGDKLFMDIQNDKIGFSDINGKVVIPCIYDFWEESISYVDGYLQLISDNKVGVISETGKIVIQFEYDFIKILSNKCARVYIDGKTGFINLKTGKFIVPLMGSENYKTGQQFDLAWLLYNGKWCVIDKNGEIFIPTDEYDEMHVFDSNSTIVRKDGRWGIVRYVSDEEN